MTQNTPDLPFNISDHHVWRPYTQMKTTPAALKVKSAQGVHIELEDGRRLIDGVSSWWTVCHGYRHPHIMQAVKAQMDRVPHVMLGGLTHAPAQTLAQRLAALAPGDLNHVFFCESGSVSVEIAMKIAMQSWINRGERGHTKFVCFKGGYHGDTLATMSVCDPEEGMHSLFAGGLQQQLVTALPRDESAREAFEALISTRRAEIAGIITEPLVQGAGGMKFHTPETLAYLRDVCDRFGLPLILDEIMTGFGRLGTMFACEKAGVIPDIMTVSKALTGGTLPLAAAIASSRLFADFWSDDAGAALMHGPTYMGNPAACAAANASIDLFEQEPRLEQVATIEALFAERLPEARDFPGIVDVRWQGAIGVLEFPAVPELEALKARFVDAGVWVRPFGNIIYLMPPYVITADELDVLITATLNVTRGWAKDHFV
ncbi:MAG: adenosylmethionine--8-amino-7-oxononanoate transaminase [Maricaulis sp.]|uniref:adenosylmethionine--8-amino-7-oxononanoate transaminase n=1 Tax=Maricaulis sp. TaxID=1486257 RepID=UPI001B19BF1A|nr:adenosylmethionine--8-amino-7-oxononanoate transaminase [Maricaulis sp.]MBO6730574.1 adenosylmethionine--8-amino-7-oxononanoate transaminase [Maricaulis sp.]MBO6846618.1 adenosylmethionine--8-amino-7-oxononanoate transaminase [Maricaulis sp.]MBO6877145.1 adenosylmethionine--8-amino-7-oxononanoate transaminase [Maricaulis sp.]